MRFYARTSRRTGVSVGPFTALLLGLFALAAAFYIAIAAAALLVLALLIAGAQELAHRYRNRRNRRAHPDR